MLNSVIARSSLVALAATCFIPFAGAFAQSVDNRSTADIEKENAALRAKVHRLEAEKENIGLRSKLDQLQGRRPVQTSATESSQGGPYPLVTRIETSSPDRTLVMADLPMKAAPAPVPYYSWSGFYLGGNIGYSVGSDRSQATVNFTGANPSTNLPGGDTAVTPAGAIGGVQIGYNWQGGPNWLAGFEADFQGSAQKATSCLLVCLDVPGALLQNLTTTQSLDYFGTVRGRFGVVDRGNLFYVTGGGAYGHVNHAIEFRDASFTAPTFSFDGSASTTENKFGWVVGAGIESSLGGNWTAKVEYLYMDLGSTATTLNGTLPAVGANPAQPFTFATTTNIRDNIVRAGLNYRFGPSAGPVSAYDAMAAVPPPVYSWTGFYVGANVGYGFGNDHSQVDLLLPSSLGTSVATSEPGTSVTPRGGLGGVQLGYNWQAGPRWVAGFEADFQGTAQNDTACSSVLCTSIIEPLLQAPESEIITVQHQLDYFGTLRGRLGFVANNTLFYATGGGAFGHVRETLHVNLGGFADQGITKDLTGYVVGGGIEAMLWGGWSAKAEYLFMNLGSMSGSVEISALGSPATLLSNSTVRDHIVRIGANYHLGAAPY
jgi:outer membrane immunogenic protein